MNKLAVIILVLLSACAAQRAGQDALEQDRAIISFVDAHQRSKADAFAAASAWASRNFPGGNNVVLSTDQASGTIVLKGAYKWVKATDPFQTHFQEGWVSYTLMLKISDKTVGLDFLTGDAYGDIDASPSVVRKEISPFYQKLRESLLQQVANHKTGT